MLSERISRGWQHTIIILRALLLSHHRRLLGNLVDFSRALPRQFDQPLPQMMAQLTPSPQSEYPLPENEVRQLADAVAAWHIRSPLGICLRRSLLRYHFLRKANVPVRIIFGARFKQAEEGGSIGGHAWLSLNNLPYYENPNNYEGFVEMYQYPQHENCE